MELTIKPGRLTALRGMSITRRILTSSLTVEGTVNLAGGFRDASLNSEKNEKLLVVPAGVHHAWKISQMETLTSAS